MLSENLPDMIPNEKLWNAEYLKVLATNFALYFSFYLLTPLLPLYVSETFHSTKDVIGLVLSGYTVTALLARPFSGFIVDSFSRKKVLIFFLALNVIFFGGYLVAGTLALFAIVRTLHGGPFGSFTVANSTVGIDVLPSSRRNEGIGYYGLSNNLATALAPSIGICIYKYIHSFDFLFWIAMIVSCFGLYMGSRVKLPERKVAASNKRPLSLDRFFLIKGWMLGINLAFFGFCYGIISNYVAIYGKEAMGITGGTGIFFMLFSIGLILSRLQGAKALREGRLVFNAIEGIIIGTCGYFLFVACPTSFGFYSSAFLIGLGNGHFWPAFQNMIISIAEHDERGTATSTLFTSWDTGLGLGVLFGGAIAEHLGYSAAFWFTAIVHATGAILFLAATKKFYLKKLAARQLP